MTQSEDNVDTYFTQLDTHKHLVRHTHTNRHSWCWHMLPLVQQWEDIWRYYLIKSWHVLIMLAVNQVDCHNQRRKHKHWREGVFSTCTVPSSWPRATAEGCLHKQVHLILDDCSSDWNSTDPVLPSRTCDTHIDLCSCFQTWIGSGAGDSLLRQFYSRSQQRVGGRGHHVLILLQRSCFYSQNIDMSCFQTCTELQRMSADSLKAAQDNPNIDFSTTHTCLHLIACSENQSCFNK